MGITFKITTIRLNKFLSTTTGEMLQLLLQYDAMKESSLISKTKQQISTKT